MNQTYLARTTQSSFLLSPYPFHPWTNVETVSLLQRSLSLPSQTGTKANERVPWLSLWALPLRIGNRRLLPSSNTFHMMLTDLQWQFQVLSQVLMEASWISLEQFKLLHHLVRRNSRKFTEKFQDQWLLFYTVAD